MEILSSLNVEPDKAPAALFESLTLDSAAVSFPTARQTLSLSRRLLDASGRSELGTAD
jgi:hypothetical protein